MSRALLLLGMTLALAACGERAQTLNAESRKSDAPAWSKSAAANPAFAAKGYQSGDKTAWENQLRQRNQAQNN